MDNFVAKISEEANCSPEKVCDIVSEALKALHKIAYCDKYGVTAALRETYFHLGPEACYHLGGIIIESCSDDSDEAGIWSEVLERFAPDLKKFRSIIEDWDKEIK